VKAKARGREPGSKVQKRKKKTGEGLRTKGEERSDGKKKNQRCLRGDGAEEDHNGPHCEKSFKNVQRGVPHGGEGGIKNGGWAGREKMKKRGDLTYV